MLNNLAFGIATLLIIISLIVMFCVLLVKLHIRKIKNYTKVIYEKDLDFQKAINTTIIETQEQVLNNISQDLHDDAGQQLTAINFQLENLKIDSPELRGVLQPISTSIAGLAQSVRSLSHSLNNQLLTKQDLFKAITAEAERLQKNLAFPIQVIVDDEIRKNFSSNEKIVIYRIFQEIMNNILKHANPDTVTIALTNRSLFQMKITDNGRGFDTSQATKNISLGLVGMAKRANFIGYTLDIQSEPGIGTTITLNETLN
jgi:signal transduction histidine kinase